MAWTKAKTTIAVAAGGFLLAGIIAMPMWSRDSQERAQAVTDRLIRKQIATPLALTNNYNSGVNGPVPSGLHVFNNVPLQIDGAMYLWGSGGGADYPKKIRDIPLSEIFETLYLYHGSYYGSPPGTPVCDVVFRYVDDTSVTNRLFYETDILDWYAPGGTRVKGPSGTNSKVAWIGQLTTGNGGIQQLRLCMTAIENPKPTVKVWSIDLYSCESRTVLYIMAMTTGKADLMEDATPTDERER